MTPHIVSPWLRYTLIYIVKYNFIIKYVQGVSKMLGKTSKVSSYQHMY